MKHDHFGELHARREAALIARFGPDMAAQISPHFQAAITAMAQAAAKCEGDSEDCRDLFILFSQSLSDANNLIESLLAAKRFRRQ